MNMDGSWNEKAYLDPCTLPSLDLPGASALQPSWSCAIMDTEVSVSPIVKLLEMAPLDNERACRIGMDPKSIQSLSQCVCCERTTTHPIHGHINHNRGIIVILFVNDTISFFQAP